MLCQDLHNWSSVISLFVVCTGYVDDFDQPAERGGYDEDSPGGLRSKAAVAHHAWWLTEVCALLTQMMSDDSAQRPSMVEAARRIRIYRDVFVAGTIARADSAADFGTRLL